MVIPVNYKLHEGTTVFRTGQDSPVADDLRTGIADVAYKVAFEIDSLGIGDREGWFVSFTVPPITWTRTPSAHPLCKRTSNPGQLGKGNTSFGLPNLDHRSAYRPGHESARC